jgi:hypothetical protein
MNGRWRRLLRLAALLLLIVAAGQAVWRLGLERILVGSLLLVEGALEHPYLATLILLVLDLLAMVWARDAVVRPGVRLVLSRVLVWLVSIVTGVLLFQILAGVGVALLFGPSVYKAESLREAVLQHPVLHGVNLVLFGLLWFVVIRRDYRRVIARAVRAFIVAVCALALIFSAELSWMGIIGLGVDGASSISNYLLLCGGLFLVFVWAAGVKYAFRLPLTHWAIFAASVVSILMILAGNALEFLPLG